MGRKQTKVESLRLPKEVINELKLKGIKYLTPPQEEAVKKGLLNGENILVASPTASGKTLIAELALINAFLRGRKGIYTTPLKTLANEKYEEFSLWSKIGAKIGISTGDYDEPGEWLDKYDIIVTTYERLDSLFRLRPKWLRKVGVVVIDELHNISDEERGPTIELIAIYALKLGAQIVGLSATLSNPEELAEWLGCKLVLSNWRPVKLIEGFYIKRRSIITFNDGRTEEVLNNNLIDHIVRNALNQHYQVIIFQQARHKAESMAKNIASKVPVIDRNTYLEIIDKFKKYEALRSEIKDLDKLVMHGAAYHHAGLSHGARLAIENSFRSGLIRFVVATPTLAAGINMPARRVVIYTRRFEGGYVKPISIAEYKQMAGRAGRPQYDVIGEAIIADVKDEGEGWRYINGRPEPVKSALISERALRIHTLSLIASGYVEGIDELRDLLRKTLAYKNLLESRGVDITNYVIKNILPRLMEMDMIRADGKYLYPTRLGLTVSRLYVDPLTAIMIIDELEGIGKPSPLYYLTLIAMTPDFTRVRIVGYKGLQREAYSAYESGLIPGPIRGVSLYDWLKAYKIGLILNQWINEVDEDYIITTFKIGAGDLNLIIETASWLTYAASKICESVGLKNHANELNKLSLRVRYGVKEELIDLVRIKGIGRVRARLMYMHGIRTIDDILNVGIERIAKIPMIGEVLAKSIINEAKKLKNK